MSLSADDLPASAGDHAPRTTISLWYRPPWNRRAPTTSKGLEANRLYAPMGFYHRVHPIDDHMRHFSLALSFMHILEAAYALSLAAEMPLKYS
jgi:hypothetical protein